MDLINTSEGVIMPTYMFRNSETGDIFEKNMKMSELDQYKLDNPTHERYYDGVAAMIGDPVRLGVTKMDSGFKEVLQKVNERNPLNDLRKTSKQL